MFLTWPDMFLTMVAKNLFVPGNLQFYSDVPANISLDFSAKFPPILLIGS